MASLKLDNREVAEMRAFYQTELVKALARLEHIKDVLDKLGDSGSGISIKVNGNVTTQETKPTAQKSVSTRKGKPGPDSIWEKMVLKRLRAVDKPLTYEELTDEIMEFAKFPKENRKKVKQSLINVTFRLRKRDRKINTFSNGSREKYLALSSWFDSSGIMDSYRNKLNPPKSKKPAIKAKAAVAKVKPAAKSKPIKKSAAKRITSKKVSTKKRLAAKKMPR